ncbi:MAG: hypothetical protein ACTHL8_05415 [Burkholderiaceae bacterium]
MTTLADIRTRLARRGLIVTALPHGGFLVAAMFEHYAESRDGVPIEATLLEGVEFASLADVERVAQ